MNCPRYVEPAGILWLSPDGASAASFMCWTRAWIASAPGSSGGRVRNMRPKRPSLSVERATEACPRTWALPWWVSTSGSSAAAAPFVELMGGATSVPAMPDLLSKQAPPRDDRTPVACRAWSKAALLHSFPVLPHDKAGDDAGDDEIDDCGEAPVQRHLHIAVVRREQVVERCRQPAARLMDGVDDPVGRVRIEQVEHDRGDDDRRDDGCSSGDDPCNGDAGADAAAGVGRSVAIGGHAFGVPNVAVHVTGRDRHCHLAAGSDGHGLGAAGAGRSG